MSIITIKNFKRYNKLVQKLKKKEASINKLLNKISKVNIEIISNQSEPLFQNQHNKN